MKRLKILFTILLLFAFVSPAISDELTDDYFDIAQNYLNSGDSTKALEYVKYVLMLNPKFTKAIKLKDKLIPQETNDDLTSTAMILSQQQGKVSDFAILDVPKSNKYKVENTSDYYNRQGKQFYLNEEYDSAIQSFFRAVSVDNKNYIAYNNLGMTYWMKNNLESAEKYFKKAASLSKSYPQPYINLALLYKQKGDLNKYYSYLTEALEVNPNNYWTYYLLGDFYTSIDNYAKSVAYYLDAISLNPNFSPPYLALGVSYFKTDKYEQSIVSLKSYIELNPNSDFAYSMLAKNYYLLGEYQTAKKFMKKALSINPINAYRMELAKIEFNAGEYNNALLNFQILEPEYQYAELYNYIGLCYLMLKKYELSIQNFNKAIVADSRRPIYYYNLAQCYKALDEKQKYVQYMNMALQITPVTYQDYIDLSCIYYNTGKITLAVKMLQSGISVYPDTKQLYLALLSLYDRIDDNAGYNTTKNIIETRFNSDEQKKTFKLFK